MFQLGLCYLEKNWPKRALECFQQALEKNPRRLEYQEAVRLLERRRRYELPRVDGPGAAAFREAEESAARGSLRRAHELYRKALEAEPRNPTIRISFALLCASWGAGRRRSRRAARSSPAEPEDVVAAAACSTLAEALRAEGRPREAAGSCASSSSSTFEDRAGRRLLRARDSLAETGEDLDSPSTTRAARSRRARRAQAVSARGARLGPLQAPGVRPGDRVPARSSERAAAPTTLHHLGMAYLAAGRAEEAKAAFTRAKTAARGAGSRTG